MRVIQYGERALLLEVANHVEALALYEKYELTPPEGLVDIVPAAATVLVVFETEDHARAASAVVREKTVSTENRVERALVEIPVVYDGEDLHEVATALLMSVDEVVERHQAAEYLVAFTGFVPGFAYLAGLDTRLHMPRRDVPRTRVPAGSVAIAGDFTAVYPRQSPGGWQLLGHTDLAMWDIDRQPPAVLQPGTRVRFRRVP